MDVDPVGFSYGGGVVSFLWVPYHFLLDVSGGSGLKITHGITGDCATSSSIVVDGQTNATMSSVMGIGEGVSTPYS